MFVCDSFERLLVLKDLYCICIFVFEAEEIEFIMSNYTQLKNCSAAVEEVKTNMKKCTKS